jgi:hypothetical protein
MAGSVGSILVGRSPSLTLSCRHGDRYFRKKSVNRHYSHGNIYNGRGSAKAKLSFFSRAIEPLRYIILTSR